MRLLAQGPHVLLLRGLPALRRRVPLRRRPQSAPPAPFVVWRRAESASQPGPGGGV